MEDFGWKFRVWWWRLFPPNSGAIAATMQLEGYTEFEIDYELWEFKKMHANDLKKILLEAPEGQLNASLKPLIEKWSTPPKAIEILEVLDRCTKMGMASGFTINLLTTLYVLTRKDEGVTHDDVVSQATWRHPRE